MVLPQMALVASNRAGCFTISLLTVQTFSLVHALLLITVARLPMHAGVQGGAPWRRNPGGDDGVGVGGIAKAILCDTPCRAHLRTGNPSAMGFSKS